MGKLYIVSTPIGNLEDITLRAIKTLFSSDLILCEDTRHTDLLLHELKSRYVTMFRYMITKPNLMSYYDEIEDKRIPEVIELLGQGKNIALVSDAGTPLISDPGFRLVRECLKRGIAVESIPGPSAVLAALTSSGLPPDRFLFLGYPPEKQSARLKLFKELKPNITTIFYCAPHKFLSTIDDLRSVFGDIDIVIARELTKVHEEVWRGKLSDAMLKFAKIKGELVVLCSIA
jgi:16S rRNA (cytidine1402-2'-O)-methyltransferase